MRNGRGRKEGRRGREEGGVYRKGRESKLKSSTMKGVAGYVDIYII